MKMRKENLLMNMLLGTGVYLLDSLRDRLGNQVDDISEKARDTYDTASSRVSRATDALRGNDHHLVGAATAALLGLGIGVGIGMLIAPASGDQTRNNLADKVQDLGGKVRNRFSSEPQGASGTYGQ
jgi:hypothetical protein